MADPAKAATINPAIPAPAFSNASLYVGDLASDVGEGNLFDIFNRIGPVSSIRVCRDTGTRRSLGYAYVNFHNPQDAERALDTLNNSLIRGKACRIMWSQRDPSLRKSGVGNIFIKNLHPSIDHATLKETFSLYGNIISCKVATDENNNSKGYGFVHFETQEMADKAIEKLNGMNLEGQTLHVAHFIPRRERQTKDKEQFTNVFVKNLDENIDNEKLKQIFEKFGPSTSATLAYDADTNVSKCFGFVNFERHEDAKRAIDELNGKPLTEGGKELYVGRAQKRSERDAELRAKQSQRVEKYAGVNLYIKNLDDDVDDDRLRTEFGQFGTIQSAKVMKDEKGNSKGFGFVSLATPEEANRAVNEMNGKTLSTKPLYVALAQKKEQRKAQLEAQFRNKAQMKIYSGASPPVFYAPPQAQGFVYPAQMMPRNTGYRAERWGVPNPPISQYQPVNFMVPGRPPRQHIPRNPTNRRFNRGGGAGGSGAPREQQIQPTGQPVQQTQQLAQQLPQQAQQSPGIAPNDVLPEFTVEYLAQIPAAEQSAAIGERLFTLISRINAENAGKITGMLLESFKTEVPEETLVIINNPQLLNDKVNEAMIVLQQHAQQSKVEPSK